MTGGVANGGVGGGGGVDDIGGGVASPGGKFESIMRETTAKDQGRQGGLDVLALSLFVFFLPVVISLVEIDEDKG